MKPVLRFLILLFVFALGQQSFAYSWNKVDAQKNLLTTNCQLSELQMDITVCNDSIFVAEVSFVTNNPNPFGYNVLIDGVFYTFNQYEDTLAQSFVIEFIDPDLGSEITAKESRMLLNFRIVSPQHRYYPFLYSLKDNA